ncbi:MAG TPA: cysteine dioxygenase family protein [Bordetella sp.]|jgi:predicted metal-dependent enzyme (double-stranded beta helix superfamily)|nr:cysteine dioxygenase family protein [Bordetella sp.]
MQHRSPPPLLAPICDSILAARHLSGDGLLGALAKGVADTDTGSALDALCPDALAMPRGGYTRHVAYADPQGQFTIVYLVWPPGQFSPVHGHHTWCAYRVVKGELTETLYVWDEQAQCARAQRDVPRRPGDIVTSASGLLQIHRLGNAGDDVAVSLHVYGIDAQALATGVNHVVASMPASAAVKA